jgi:hypothetical protein
MTRFTRLLANAIPFLIPTVGGLGEDASVGPLQRFHVDQFKLRAIIRGIGEAKAMFQDLKDGRISSPKVI